MPKNIKKNPLFGYPDKYFLNIILPKSVSNLQNLSFIQVFEMKHKNNIFFLFCSVVREEKQRKKFQILRP